TGPDLQSLGVVDEVLPEPAGGNNWAPLQAGEVLKEAIERHLSELELLSPHDLREQRYRKFRAMGRVLSSGTTEIDPAV
ncbi:MAG: acetyl-CoA carboxylase carboxyl transferase subunit alpha, partial [Synechococcaceae bacterium WB9_4xC_028]|nr:acetyl-CoA carboxylase carboxyl transferase subunit alpha [Synechococcaceae bacterium WB9_4xC_028]